MQAKTLSPARKAGDNKQTNKLINTGENIIPTIEVGDKLIQPLNTEILAAI